jgi:hypothetical protein
MTLSLSTSFLPAPAAAARTTSRTLRSVVPSQVRAHARIFTSDSYYGQRFEMKLVAGFAGDALLDAEEGAASADLRGREGVLQR